MKKYTLISCLIFVSLVTFAQTEKVITDRPGKTLSPITVPKKWIQFESELSKQKDKLKEIGITDIYFRHPSLLTKFGLGKRLELRLITELATLKVKYTFDPPYIRTGIKTVQLGGKLNFLKEKGIRPEVSLIAHYDFHRLRTIYAGKDTLDGGNFRLAMQHTLSEKVEVGYNIGMEWEYFRYFKTAYTYTLSPKFTINEKWLAYIELFGYIWKKEKPENSIDAGFAYFINDNFKLDASAGFGINKKAPDNFFSIGASFRFKTNRSN
ncbi:MAG: transporter [Chitinophagaceae bacterium]|nr:transporter [Chitinophagaceae bacterium]